MSFKPAEYDPSKLSIGEPEASDGAYDYATMKFSYAGGRLSFYMPGDNAGDPGVQGSRISENPKKPGQLTQGVHVKGDSFLKMAEDIQNRAFQAIIDHKDHKGMPKNIKNFTSVEELKKLFPSIKGMIHYPMKKDAKGNSTDQRDPEADPMFYFTLMRAALDGPKQGEIYSKYYSAQMLSPATEAAIKRGERRESEFIFPVITDPKQPAKKGLFESKTGMKMIPTIIVGDVFVSANNIKIRSSISDSYIREFRSGEPQSRQNVRSIMAGIAMDEALVVPDAPEENDTNVVNNNLGPAEAAKGFTVEVVGE